MIISCLPLTVDAIQHCLDFCIFWLRSPPTLTAECSLLTLLLPLSFVAEPPMIVVDCLLLWLML